jgi:hypothetical protein
MSGHCFYLLIELSSESGKDSELGLTPRGSGTRSDPTGVSELGLTPRGSDPTGVHDPTGVRHDRRGGECRSSALNGPGRIVVPSRSGARARSDASRTTPTSERDKTGTDGRNRDVARIDKPGNRPQETSCVPVPSPSPSLFRPSLFTRCLRSTPEVAAADAVGGAGMPVRPEEPSADHGDVVVCDDRVNQLSR